MTYEQQIQKLRDKNLTITDENEAKSILQQDGYYALITGYKDLFKNPSTKNYRDGTTLQDILALYQFGDQQISHDGLLRIMGFPQNWKKLTSYRKI